MTLKRFVIGLVVFLVVVAAWFYTFALMQTTGHAV